MGMRATIKTSLYPEGYETKYTGLLADTCSHLGFKVESGYLELTKEQVNHMIFAMWQKIYSGQFVKTAGYASHSTETLISLQHCYNISNDVVVLILLIEWLQEAKDDEFITFS